jgi:hypothetical protein
MHLNKGPTRQQTRHAARSNPTDCITTDIEHPSLTPLLDDQSELSYHVRDFQHTSGPSSAAMHTRAGDFEAITIQPLLHCQHHSPTAHLTLRMSLPASGHSVSLRTISSTRDLFIFTISQHPRIYASIKLRTLWHKYKHTTFYLAQLT